MDRSHLRNRSLDSCSPTSPLSRAGSTHFRSPLSVLRREVAALPAKDRSLPLLPKPPNPSFPLAFRTPYRNRSSRASTVQVHSGSQVPSQTASVSGCDSDVDSEETVRYVTPLSRVWSTPDIEWPAVRDWPDDGEDGEDYNDEEDEDSILLTTPWPPLSIRRRTQAGPSLLICTPTEAGSTPSVPAPSRSPNQLTAAPPMPPPPPLRTHITTVVVPSPISPGPSRPRSLSLIGLPVKDEDPVLPRNEPSPLRRSHAISRRPSPAPTAHTPGATLATAFSQSFAYPVPVYPSRPHSHSQSLSVHYFGPAPPAAATARDALDAPVF